jgi:hypothetical protein
MDRVALMRLLVLVVLVTIPAVYGERESIVRKPAQQAQTVDLKNARRAQLEIAAAMLELKDQYPDFEDYASRILELSDAFLPGKTVSARNYLEGLYFIAKHSTPSSDRSGATSETEPAKTR